MLVETGQKSLGVQEKLKAWWKDFNIERWSYDNIGYWREFQTAQAEWYGSYFQNLSNPRVSTLRPYAVGFQPLRFYLPQATAIPKAIAAVEIALALTQHFKLSQALRYEVTNPTSASRSEIRVASGYDRHDAYAKERGQFGIGLLITDRDNVQAVIFPANYDHYQGYSAKKALDIKRSAAAFFGEHFEPQDLKIDPRGDFPAAISETMEVIGLNDFTAGLPRDPQAYLRRFQYRRIGKNGYWEALIT